MFYLFLVTPGPVLTPAQLGDLVTGFIVVLLVWIAALLLAWWIVLAVIRSAFRFITKPKRRSYWED